jgi:hypothetical protein
MRYYKILLVSALLLSSFSIATLAQSRDDFDVYNRLATIKGNVQLLNQPEYGKVPAGGQYLVFQRDGCKYCLVATNADKDGNYKIRVGQGKYKVIVYNPSSVFYDMLALDQPRYVTATSVIEDTQFDIKLVIPSDKKPLR